MTRCITGLIALLLACNVLAAIDTWQFKDEAQEQMFRDITSQLRCPKCQNNSVADSNAMIAADMRLKVYELLRQGQNRQQIIDYMVARYGNFVSYEPPLTAGTIALWLIPALFTIAGATVVVIRSQRRNTSNGVLSDDESARLSELLEKGKDV
jgi:cytochrome c-type biogenesis protein CcmH